MATEVNSDDMCPFCDVPKSQHIGCNLRWATLTDDKKQRIYDQVKEWVAQMSKAAWVLDIDDKFCPLCGEVKADHAGCGIDHSPLTADEIEWAAGVAEKHGLG